MLLLRDILSEPEPNASNDANRLTVNIDRQVLQGASELTFVAISSIQETARVRTFRWLSRDNNNKKLRHFVDSRETKQYRVDDLFKRTNNFKSIIITDMSLR